MKKSAACLTIALLASTCLPVQAALVRYDYAGTLGYDIGDPRSHQVCDESGNCTLVTTGVPAGTTFFGSWTVDTAQVGVPFDDSGSLIHSFGQIYDLEQFTLTIADSALVGGRREDTIYVTTTDLMGNYADSWPSGYSTDYSFRGAVLNPGEFVVAGVELDRISINFNHDGNDLWTDFALPGNADFFSDMELRFIVFEPGYVTGTITSLTATVVPLPTLLPVTVLALALIRRRRQVPQLNA